MNDGVKLSADVYRPARQDRYPVLLARLPYNKDVGMPLNESFDVLRAVQAGYVVVAQDTRGRYASEGDFNPFFDEAADGAGTIAWAAAQPWSTGAVGMFGASYFGATQWTAAAQAPPALRAIAPVVTTDQYYESWAYQGGAFQLGFNLHWVLFSLALGEVVRRMGSGAATPEGFAALVAAVDHNDELYDRLPLRAPAELKNLAPYYDDWLDHPSYDEFWKATAPRESFGDIVVPALNIGGWCDIFLKGTLANYVGMKQYGCRPMPRRRVRSTDLRPAPARRRKRVRHPVGAQPGYPQGSTETSRPAGTSSTHVLPRVRVILVPFFS
jgi:putative CocE/NonD family hydrolase